MVGFGFEDVKVLGKKSINEKYLVGRGKVNIQKRKGIMDSLWLLRRGRERGRNPWHRWKDWVHVRLRPFL